MSAWATFFYGITFKKDECRSKMIFKELKNYQPSDQESNAANFDEDQWYKVIQNEGYLDEAVRDLDDVWENQNDPICIGVGYGSEDIIFYLAIRTTIHSSGSSFDLSQYEPKEWDLLLKEKCDHYGINWEQPTFHVIGGYH